MSLKNKLTNDMKAAMRSGDQLSRNTLRMILAAIKQVEIDQQTTLDDAEIMALIQKEAKKRQETIHDFEQAGRPEEAATEHTELEIISAYLPEQVSEQDIIERAQAIIQEQGLEGPQSIGFVMKPLMEEFKGRADGRLINQVVRKLLTT
ncbi:MAG: GatB/YqeY domain-containing protein [Anaerolineales bacterium]|nr:GatB/YqeY domain-containing protein [Anaerolineales bacterium]